jgi:hypothetical protein
MEEGCASSAKRARVALVSVIMPVHNAEQYLDETFASVASSSHCGYVVEVRSLALRLPPPTARALLRELTAG